MATNGNNGGTINYSSPGKSNMGITGGIQNRRKGQEFHDNFFRETSGYLDNTTAEMQNLIKGYKEISALTDKMTKAEQTRFKKMQESFKEQVKTLEYVKDTREIDYEEANKLIKESNKLLISGAKEYQKILESINERQSEADDEHLKSLDETVNKINKIKENAEKTNQDLKDTAKVLNNSTSNLGDAISNTLKKSGDIVANISNMLNLSSLANNALEQSTRSKLASQNSIMKQLGMTSESQYSQFKNSLTSTLQDMNSSMGNLFSADDMYTYFENLSEYGVTNQKVAEEQLKASVLGNKYLGVSNETQSLIFKFMKRTNNYDTLNEHNKTIVGLLKSELGVSKEQLDALSEIAYAGADSKAAIGMSSKAISNQSEAMTTIGAAIESVYGSSASQSFENALNDFLLNPGNESWIQTLGSDYTSTYNKLFSSQSYDEQVDAIKSFWDALQNSSLINNGASGSGLATGLTNKTYQGLSALDDSLIAALKGGKDTELLEAETKAIAGVLSTTQKNVEDYVQDTTEITLLESLENSTSFIKDKVESWNNGVFNLANIALSLYIASGLTKGLTNFIGGWKSGGGLKGGLLALFGGSSGTGTKATEALTGMSSTLLAGGLAVGLTAAAISAISSIVSSMNKDSNEHGAAVATAATSDTKYENNAGVNALIASSAATEDRGWLQNDWGNFTSGLSYFGSVIGGGVSSKNKNLTKWIMSSDTFGSSTSGIMQNLAVWALMMDKAGYYSSFQSAMEELGQEGWKSSTAKQIANYLEDCGWTDEDVNRVANSIISAGWKPYFKDESRMESASLSLDGYHKAGKYYIPKDNYKALLHKGEMVLTEKQANSYREMEKSVGGQSDSLYSKQQKIVLGKTIPSSSDVLYAGAQMGLPSGWTVTSGYGTYTSMRDSTGKIAKHRGIDFAAATGTEVRAANPGTAYLASSDGGYGNTIRIATSSGLFNRYGHFSAFASGLKSGDKVKRGQLIGYVGSTGNSTGPHLHFQVNKTNNETDDINPWPYVMMDIFGGSGSLGISGATSSSSTSATAIPKATTRRFINGATIGGAESNVGGADRVVNSVDGGFNRLIAYLDNISKRQDEQQVLLEAFSKSRSSSKDI